MANGKSDALTAWLAVGFVVLLGLSIWTWTSYAAHAGSLEQIGDAIMGVVLGGPTIGLGILLWTRLRRPKSSQPDQLEPPA